jgi:hypothetical protein
MNIGTLPIVDILKVGLAGLAFLFFLLAWNLLRKEQQKDPPRQPILGMIKTFMLLSLALVAIIGGFEFAGRFGSHPNIPPPPPSPPTPQKELTLNSVRYEHTYDNSGDFEGVIIYDVVNNTDMNLTRLVPHRATWFGQKIKYSAELYIQGKDKSLYSLKSSMYGAHEHCIDYIGGEKIDVTTFWWFPELRPPLSPKKQLTYYIKIKTEKTEEKIFSPDGSYAGMQTPLPCGEISCKVNSPSGYTLSLISYLARDSLGIDLKTTNLPKPSISHDGSYIEWRVQDPIPEGNYVMNIRLDKKGSS